MDCTNKNCPAYAKCLAPYRGSRCKATRATYGLGDPMTNADKLRAMSDEELATWLCDVAGWLPTFEGRVHPILEWLKQEAVE